jgi:hypothetical protein
LILWNRIGPMELSWLWMIAIGIRVRSLFTQDCRPGAFSAVPAGLVSVGTHTQHCVLGYSQPSLAGLFTIHPDR